MKTKPTSTRGGTRKGSGRPRLGADDLNLVAVRLTNAQLATAIRLGDGNISAGIRAALELAAQQVT